jgi:hypothetical protein
LSLHAIIQLPKRILKDRRILENVQEAAEMGFWLDALVADIPEVFSEFWDFDVWEFILEDVNVVDYFAEDEVRT